MRGRITFVVGTRPEFVKTAPVIEALIAKGIEPVVITTGQHSTLLEGGPQITATHALELPSDGNVDGWLQKAGVKLGLLLNELQPSLVVVQGDTASAVCGALTAKIRKTPIAHIEAGIRSGLLDEPYPEEGFRRKITRWASYHFAPTALAAANLIGEGVPEERITITGNPVVSALAKYTDAVPVANPKPVIVFSMHRREWLAQGEVWITRCVRALAGITAKNPHLTVVWPIHPNVEKHHAVRSKALPKNLCVVDPMAYKQLMSLVAESLGVATDSGGLQEEAATLGVPCAVLRNVSDRAESISLGLAKLFEPSPEGIQLGISALAAQILPRSPSNIYGTADSAERIAIELARIALKEPSFGVVSGE